MTISVQKFSCCPQRSATRKPSNLRAQNPLIYSMQGRVTAVSIQNLHKAAHIELWGLVCVCVCVGVGVGVGGCSEIWQASRQHRSCTRETLRDLTLRSVIRYWIGLQVDTTARSETGNFYKSHHQIACTEALQDADDILTVHWWMNTLLGSRMINQSNLSK